MAEAEGGGVGAAIGAGVGAAVAGDVANKPIEKCFGWSSIGNAVFGLTDGAGNQQSFEVQPDKLPQLMAGLDEVRGHYEAAQLKARELSTTMPPFGDDTTVAVTKKICERAEGGEGSLTDTAQSMVDWVDGFKAAVQAAIQEHQRIDEENMRMA